MSAQKFFHISRFVDDLITINKGNFEKNVWDIWNSKKKAKLI